MIGKGIEGIIGIIFLVLLFKIYSDGYCKSICKNMKKDFGKSILYIIIGIIIVIILIFTIDGPISKHFAIVHGAGGLYFFKTLDFYFKTIPMMAEIIIIYIISFIVNRSSKFHKILSIAIITFFLGLIFGTIFKGIFLRERPFVALNPHMFFSYSLFFKHISDKYLSMPSLHAIRATTIFVPFIIGYRNIVVRIILGFMVILVAFSRVYILMHWSSDVTAGVFIGIFLAASIYLSNKKKLNN